MTEKEMQAICPDFETNFLQKKQAKKVRWTRSKIRRLKKRCIKEKR